MLLSACSDDRTTFNKRFTNALRTAVRLGAEPNKTCNLGGPSAPCGISLAYTANGVKTNVAVRVDDPVSGGVDFSICETPLGDPTRTCESHLGFVWKEKDGKGKTDVIIDRKATWAAPQLSDEDIQFDKEYSSEFKAIPFQDPFIYNPRASIEAHCSDRACTILNTDDKVQLSFNVYENGLISYSICKDIADTQALCREDDGSIYTTQFSTKTNN
jgi:hypothetical protein